MTGSTLRQRGGKLAERAATEIGGQGLCHLDCQLGTIEKRVEHLRIEADGRGLLVGEPTVLPHVAGLWFL